MLPRTASDGPIAVDEPEGKVRVPRWFRRSRAIVLLGVALVLLTKCAVACPGLFPAPIGKAAIDARVRWHEDELIGEARQVIADPNSPTDLYDSPADGDPIIARRVGAAAVGRPWYDGIPAKNYGPVFDPDGLITRFGDARTARGRG